MVWHDYMALLLVAIAVAVVLRRAYRTFVVKSSGAGCGSGCGTCPSNTPRPPALLSIDDDFRQASGRN